MHCFGESYLRNLILSSILCFSFVITYANRIDTMQYPLQKFIGEWTLKDNIFESSNEGVYKADVNPKRTFKAREVNTATSILWDQDFDGFKVDIFWSYDIETKTVYHLSNTSNNGLASGKGLIAENGDMNLTLHYPDACETCSRLYTFQWKSDDEFFFRAIINKDDKPTGDFYGATFLRKKE